EPLQGQSAPINFTVSCVATNSPAITAVGWQDPTVSSPWEHHPMTPDVVYVDWDNDVIRYDDGISQSFYDVGLDALNNMLAVRFTLTKDCKLIELSAAMAAIYEAKLTLFTDNNGQPGIPYTNAADGDPMVGDPLEYYVTPNPQNINVNLPNRGTNPWISVSLWDEDIGPAGSYPICQATGTDVWETGSTFWGVFYWDEPTQDVPRLYADERNYGDPGYDMARSRSFYHRTAGGWFEDVEFNYMLRLDTAKACFRYFDLYRYNCPLADAIRLNEDRSPVTDDHYPLHGSIFFDDDDPNDDGVENFDTFLDC
ncbi:MAG: hypothetical protein GY869_14135, partial [Planctomycetes bacterium]|nr:hypothetical protein [Planctomycetota bacterium]